MSSEALSRYHGLVQKLDEKTAELSESLAGQMSCRAACHGCCAPGLSVFPVEADAIRAHVAAHPGLETVLLENAQQNPFGGERCGFLNAKGLCGIYEQRPLICRSHGFPIRLKSDKGPKVDACPLNFTDAPLDQLPDSAQLNLELINTLLVLINSLHTEGQDREREILHPEALLGPKACVGLCP